jgi:hypothetical protein
MPRYNTLVRDAARVGISERTFRRYVGKGFFPGYRAPGVRGLIVDSDEVDAALLRLPARVARPGYASYGPRADIRTLPLGAVPVDVGAER